MVTRSIRFFVLLAVAIVASLGGQMQRAVAQVADRAMLDECRADEVSCLARCTAILDAYEEAYLDARDARRQLLSFADFSGAVSSASQCVRLVSAFNSGSSRLSRGFGALAERRNVVESIAACALKLVQTAALHPGTADHIAIMDADSFCVTGADLSRLAAEQVAPCGQDSARMEALRGSLDARALIEFERATECVAYRRELRDIRMRIPAAASNSVVAAAVESRSSSEAAAVTTPQRTPADVPAQAGGDAPPLAVERPPPLKPTTGEPDEANRPSVAIVEAPPVVPNSTTPKFTQRLTVWEEEVDPGPAGTPPEGEEGRSIAVARRIETASPSSPKIVPAVPALPSAERPGGQRAILYEEQTSTAQGTAEAGNTIWSLVQESPGGDLPPEAAIRAETSIPGKDVQLRMTIRRNGDTKLPASHIVELIFLTPDGFEGVVIDNVLRMSMKDTEEATGNQLVGLPAKIGDGFFLIALGDTQAERDQNLQLLRRSKWIDVPIVYRTGRRALVTMERGVSGDLVFAAAMHAWTAAGSAVSIAVAPQAEPNSAPTIRLAAKKLGWFMQIASSPTVLDTKASIEELERRFPRLLQGKNIALERVEDAAKAVRWRARLYFSLREQADALCSELKQAGGVCYVAAREIRSVEESIEDGGGLASNGGGIPTAADVPKPTSKPKGEIAVSPSKVQPLHLPDTNMRPIYGRALTQRIQGCWVEPTGVGSDHIAVNVRISFERDGRLAGLPVPVQDRLSFEEWIIANAAVTAVQQCAPYSLPAHDYERWKTTVIRFAVNDPAATNR